MKTDLAVSENTDKIHEIIEINNDAMSHLPPLRAIRAFEACYRLGSYTRAAKELNVQQPAVSHQIRSLEKDLGVKLFVKRGTAMEPTGQAHDYYRTVSMALGDIERASVRMRRRRQDNSVTLATYPGIASFWALPRLAKLKKRSPQTIVRVTTAELDAHIPLDDVDCAILFGKGDWPRFDSRLVIRESILPVAAPKIAADLAGVSVAELLKNGPLIHLEDPEHRWFTWQDWKEKFAPDAGELDQSIVVTNHGVAIHQALQGNGIALGWTGLISDLLESGVLVAMHDTPLTSSRGYHFLTSPDFQNTATCAAVSQALGLD
jgi:LysR family glycine cleavage system transcriptional activator